MKIIPAKPWVMVEYQPVHGKDEAIALCKAAFESDIDFVEALVYSTDKWVLMKGAVVQLYCSLI